MSAPRAQFTPQVKLLVDQIRQLAIGELLALREALQGEWDLPPDIGVREPRPSGGPPSLREAVS